MKNQEVCQITLPTTRKKFDEIIVSEQNCLDNLHVDKEPRSYISDTWPPDWTRYLQPNEGSYLG